MDPAFINTSDLKELGLINGNVEDSILRVVIQRVQRSVVRPILGTSMYKRICAGINDNDLNSDEVTLMDDYVIPLMVVASDRKSINATNYQIRNKNVGKGTDPNLQSVTESENLRLDNDIRLDIKIAKNELIGYLLDNEDLYPEYKSSECNYENIQPQKSKTKGTNFNLI
jgi:hypothetical protein